MTIEELYRVLCGRQTIAVMNHEPYRMLYQGNPDSIPIKLMDASIYEVRGSRTGEVVIEVKVEQN